MRVPRTFVGVLGELLITAGVVIVLYVVWELGFTAVVETREQHQVVAQLEQELAVPGPAAPATTTTKPPVGTVFAIMRIARLGGPSWARPVYSGTTRDILAKGLGYYPTTTSPGQPGNTAVAGHRTTHGNPLLDIDTIKAGDVVVLETRQGYYVYRVDRHTIVRPTQLDVVAPVPEHLGQPPRGKWLTLTSCHPKFSASQRYVVFALLDRFIPRADGLPTTLLADPAQAA